MVIPDILYSPEFKKKWATHQSTELDSLLDEVLASINESYLLYCDQQPNEGQLKVANSTRLALTQTFNIMKTTTPD